MLIWSLNGNIDNINFMVYLRDMVCYQEKQIKKGGTKITGGVRIIFGQFPRKNEE